MASAASARGVEQLGPHPGDALHQRRRRLLDDLLVAPLDRALALADGPHGAVRVGHHLHLDVVPGAAGSARRTPSGRRTPTAPRARAASTSPGSVGQRRDHPHAATAAAGRRLDQHRQLGRGDGRRGRARRAPARRRRPSSSWTRSWSPSPRSLRPAARSRSIPARAPPRRTPRSPRGIRSRGESRRRPRPWRRRSAVARVEVAVGAAGAAGPRRRPRRRGAHRRRGRCRPRPCRSPGRRQVANTRRAISPRLATSDSA